MEHNPEGCLTKVKHSHIECGACKDLLIRNKKTIKDLVLAHSQHFEFLHGLLELNLLEKVYDRQMVNSDILELIHKKSLEDLTTHQYVVLVQDVLPKVFKSMVVLPCGHAFHFSCGASWMIFGKNEISSKWCPFCRSTEGFEQSSILILLYQNVQVYKCDEDDDNCSSGEDEDPYDYNQFVQEMMILLAKPPPLWKKIGRVAISNLRKTIPTILSTLNLLKSIPILAILIFWKAISFLLGGLDFRKLIPIVLIIILVYVTHPSVYGSDYVYPADDESDPIELDLQEREGQFMGPNFTMATLVCCVLCFLLDILF